MNAHAVTAAAVCSFIDPEMRDGSLPLFLDIQVLMLAEIAEIKRQHSW